LQITLILPTYNEAENLPKMVSALYGQPLDDLHLIIVDDNSPDGTGKLAEDMAVERPGKITVLHRARKMGLGTAYVTGYKLALEQGAQVIGQMDSDFSHPVDKLPALAKALEDCDVAIGSRYIQGGSVDERWSIWRKGLSSFGNFYSRTILGLPMHDVTGGFRLYQHNALQRMPLDRIRSNGYIFQVETAYMGHLLGLSYCEVPIYFADRRWGKSKMSFRVQSEAAFRVWQLLWFYRDMRGASHT
jgi:dolichol-phosphate mannosyltransferase